jgi:hypothetical protein
VTVDGGEIKAHRWVTPVGALRLQRNAEIELAPPTWVTFATLSVHPTVDSVIGWARSRPPDTYATRIGRSPDGLVALWAGDAGYADSEADRPGPRHRLVMAEGGWVYTRLDGSVVCA